MKPYRILFFVMALAVVPLVVSVLHAQNTANDGTTVTTVTPTATTTANVSSRTTTVDGVEVGEVLVGDTVVFRIREAAGGYTAGERANLVASRMTTLLGQGYTWQDVQVGRQNNQVVLLMGNNLLITVDQAHARANRTTPLQLAYDWQGRTQTALRAVTPGTTPGGTVAVAGTQEQWPDWTNAKSRVVPIVAAGTPGIRLGLAQVTGPEERVNQVDAVLQLDLTFQRSARVIVFIPSQSISEIDRAQGVAVSALLQYRVFEF